MEIFADPQTYISLITLTLLEIVLGIDNIIFITILAGKLPQEKQAFARRLGLGVALISRLALLSAVSWIMQLSSTLFTVFDTPFSGKSLILLFGGLFLMGKATHEIHENVNRPEEHQPQALDAQQVLDPNAKAKADPAKMMRSFVIQVVILDMVFSIDSVITAVGMVDSLGIMMAAVLISVIIMMIFAGAVGDFVQKHASVRVLALSFLVMIGLLLVAEGFGQHLNKGYVYFAMAFSLSIEMMNMRMKSRAEKLREKRAKLES